MDTAGAMRPRSEVPPRYRSGVVLWGHPVLIVGVSDISGQATSECGDCGRTRTPLGRRPKDRKLSLSIRLRLWRPLSATTMDLSGDAGLGLPDLVRRPKRRRRP